MITILLSVVVVVVYAAAVPLAKECQTAVVAVVSVAVKCGVVVEVGVELVVIPHSP